MSFSQRSKISRRQFLKGGAALAATTVVAACAPSAPAPAVQATSAPAAAATTVPAVPAATAAPVAATSGGNLVVGTVGDLTNLDPFVMTFANYPMTENVYDQFLRLDNNVQPSPGVITEWTPSADGLSMKLKVRQGIKYHDGTVATTDDVVKCIMRATNIDTAGHQYQSWKAVKSATASGNDIIDVVFSSPPAYIVPAMGFMSLIKPSAFDSLKGQAAGSGPFKVKEWVPNDHLALVKNPDYWDKGKPLLDTARINIFSDAAAMVSALEGGTLDIAMNIPPSDTERLKDKFTIVRGQDAANFYFLSMQTKKPPFDKKEVRQAMAFALDRETMCQNVLFNLSDPITSPWPKFSPGYFPEFDGMYDYNLDKAKELLTKAGYPNGIEFNIETPNSFPELAKFAEILKASLAQIGSTVTIQPMDAAQWIPILIDGTYTATFSFAGGTQWFPTRITLSNNFAVSDNSVFPDGIPPKGWVDGITQTDALFDVEKQKAAMKLAATTFMEEMWAAPIAFRYDLFALQKSVQGFGFGVYDQLRLINAFKA